MENILFDFISKYITLSDEEKKAITDLDLFSTVKKGTILLAEGQISNKNYLVLKGCLRVFYIIDGEKKTTAFYTEMEGISPHCVIDNKPSEYYISCVENSIIMTGEFDFVGYSTDENLLEAKILEYYLDNKEKKIFF